VAESHTAPRIFFATGEASGEQIAVLLAERLRAHRADLRFEGFGGDRMAAAGFRCWASTAGWASLGPFSALSRIPPLLAIGLSTALALRTKPPTAIVLVDFGAFNLRFAQLLRRLGVRIPIFYAFPPGAWFDRPAQARSVAAVSEPLLPFAHQAKFYRELGLAATYVGHPLLSVIPSRAARPPAPVDGGRLLLLPGSRDGEIERHLVPMLGAVERLRVRRPHLQVELVAADARLAARLGRAIDGMPGIVVVEHARQRLPQADAALIASGTAVLEAALIGVPCVALYRVSSAQAKIARRIWRRPYVTLPNILLDREVVPEYLQEAVASEPLADALERVLSAPEPQCAAFLELRAVLGDPETLERWAMVILQRIEATDTRDMAC